MDHRPIVAEISWHCEGSAERCVKKIKRYCQDPFKMPEGTKRNENIVDIKDLFGAEAMSSSSCFASTLALGATLPKTPFRCPVVRERFRRCITSDNFSNANLQLFERALFDVGSAAYEMEKLHRSSDTGTKLKAFLRRLREQLRFERDVSPRKEIMHRWWAGMRALKKMRLLLSLSSLRKSNAVERYTPTVLIINGRKSFDRSEWVRAARDFGAERFSDVDNNLEHQSRRLASLNSHVQNERLDGTFRATLEFWDTVQARAKIKFGGAAGSDGNTSDIFKELPFLTLYHVHKIFSERMESVSQSMHSPYWRILCFIGLPK